MNNLKPIEKIKNKISSLSKNDVNNPIINKSIELGLNILQSEKNEQLAKMSEADKLKTALMIYENSLLGLVYERDYGVVPFKKNGSYSIQPVIKPFVLKKLAKKYNLEPVFNITTDFIFKNEKYEFENIDGTYRYYHKRDFTITQNKDNLECVMVIFDYKDGRKEYVEFPKEKLESLRAGQTTTSGDSPAGGKGYMEMVQSKAIKHAIVKNAVLDASSFTEKTGLEKVLVDNEDGKYDDDNVINVEPQPVNDDLTQNPTVYPEPMVSVAQTSPTSAKIQPQSNVYDDVEFM